MEYIRPMVEEGKEEGRREGKETKEGWNGVQMSSKVHLRGMHKKKS